MENVKWINIKEKLPDDSSYYLVCSTINETRIVGVASFDYLKDKVWYKLWTGNYNIILTHVTHWMDFPKPPKL